LSAVDEAAVDEALVMADAEIFASRRIATLSDGEAQRVMLARALAQDTPAILLDEPTSFLDVPNRRRITTQLAGLAHNSHKTIIFSTHELDLAYERADSIMLLDDAGLLHLPADAMRDHMNRHPW
ncbi:MAG: ABC transporter ATP-binding protein, partial [Muribaculaceae bacterium]|nr:ABC transporter ATP-binding protein [Muribaculaceae bacterium]